MPNSGGRDFRAWEICRCDWRQWILSEEFFAPVIDCQGKRCNTSKGDGVYEADGLEGLLDKLRVHSVSGNGNLDVKNPRRSHAHSNAALLQAKIYRLYRPNSPRALNLLLIV